MATNRSGHGASQRQLLNRAATVGLLMRNSVNAGVAVLALGDPGWPRHPAGTALMATVAVWSLARLVLRSHRAVFLAVDYALVLTVCLAIPVLVGGPDFHTFNTAPQAIAGTAVISISVAVRIPVSLAATVGIAAAYAVGAAAMVGWANLGSISALHYFAVQWATASAIRFMLVRIAAAVDQARADRQEAELGQRVSDAVRDYEREQLALLHDTAASTLLMVGNGTPLPRQRLAEQARRDLDLLDKGPWDEPAPRVDLVAALRQCARLVSTPIEFAGRERLWLPGVTAEPVVAAAREVMTNVDRHARASRLTVTVSDTEVRLEDDGVGFDPRTPRSGHGVDDSIVGRMRRAGGQAQIDSAPGTGTRTRLSWTPATDTPDTGSVTDPDRLVERVRSRYSFALIAYSLVNLAISVPRAASAAGHPTAEWVMGLAAALSTLAAIPGVRHGNWRYARTAALVLLAVTIAQPALLTPDLLPGYPHWAQGAIGWCVVPLVLALPTRVGAAVLVGYWVIGSAAALVRDAAPEVWVNIGLGSASILGVQLFALIFNGLMRDAAVVIHTETQAQQRLLTRERVTSALRSEYQRRYATIVENVVPLLKQLSTGAAMDGDLQVRARAECRRLRALFDQAEVFDHPLMQRIRPLIDAAEDRRIDVDIDLAGTIPDLDPAEIDSLITSLRPLLSHAASHVRLVLTAAADAVEISVVCDTTANPTDLTFPTEVDVVSSDDEIWCLIRMLTGRR
ncbi:sensor histidine kinase [Mycolicibacterium sp.]|uniref:sensor histidine kinase n=1 Tax=Mycolicibacterium sp. TaxID=2320850 RepID=UPI003D0F5530